MAEPRGIIPTYVTAERLVLCKASPSVRNTYEIRLALYFAIKDERTFELVVPTNCHVRPDLEAHLAKWGGSIVRSEAEDFSVYFGAEGADGAELSGWVFGNREQWGEVLALLESSWLSSELRVGAEFSGDALDKLAHELLAEPLLQNSTNTDGEPFSEAVQRLVHLANESNGIVYIQ
jgi:hypothetical protein